MASTNRGHFSLLTNPGCTTYAHKSWCGAANIRTTVLTQKFPLKFFRRLIHKDFLFMPFFRAICCRPAFMRAGRASGQDVNKVIHRKPGLPAHASQIKHLAATTPHHINKRP